MNQVLQNFSPLLLGIIGIGVVIGFLALGSVLFAKVTAVKEFFET